MKSTKEEKAIDYIFLALTSVLLALCLFAPYSEGQTIPTRLVTVKHDWASTNEQLIMARAGLIRLNETGVNPLITKITVVKDTLKRNKVSQYASRLTSWQNLAYSKKWCKPNEVCFMLLPPVFDGKVHLQGGVAQAACDPYGAAYAIARVRNDTGEPRVKASLTAIAHEFGHLQGSEHVKSYNIMDPAALRFGEVILPWSLEAKEYIDACLIDEDVRQTSKYGFGNPNFKTRSFKGKIVEELVK